MIKKILVVIVATLLMAGSVYAIESVNSANGIYVGGNGAPGTPPTEYILVRFCHHYQSAVTPGINSGDVLIWDLVSADGVTISRCGANSASGTNLRVAGVALTSIATGDVNTMALKPNQSVQQWGYCAVRGFALAKVDTSEADTGGALMPAGAAVHGSFGTAPNVGGELSQDIGTLLRDQATDGLMPVWLNL